MRITDRYYFFWDTIYSQWFHYKHRNLFKEELDWVVTEYKSAEHYMMHKKALLFNDAEIAERILKAETPSEAKMLGRSIKYFNEDLWNTHKLDIVVEGNVLKFSQNPELLKDIKKYKDKIFVEASPYDKIWGIGLHYEDNRCLDESKWKGENLLGKALNQVILNLSL